MPLFLTYQSRKRAAVQQSWDEQEVPVGGQGIKHFQEKNTTNGFVRNDSDTNLHETELTYKVGQLHVDAMPTLSCVIPPFGQLHANNESCYYHCRLTSWHFFTYVTLLFAP